jgi:predicted Zn-dependent peptidase
LVARRSKEWRSPTGARAETVWSLAADRDYLERLRAVSAADVQSSARRYLTDTYVSLILSPKAAS